MSNISMLEESPTVNSDILEPHRNAILSIIMGVYKTMKDDSCENLCVAISRNLDASYGREWNTTVTRGNGLVIACRCFGVSGTFMLVLLRGILFKVMKNFSFSGEPLFFGAINTEICSASEKCTTEEKTAAIECVNKITFKTTTDLREMSDILHQGMHEKVGTHWIVIIMSNATYGIPNGPTFVVVKTKTFSVAFIKLTS